MSSFITPTKKNISSDDLLSISAEASELHNEVVIAIKKIRGHKRTLKALYRDYYQSMERLKSYVSSHEGEPIHNLIRHFLDVDDEDIFFEKRSI